MNRIYWSCHFRKKLLKFLQGVHALASILTYAVYPLSVRCNCVLMQKQGQIFNYLHFRYTGGDTYVPDFPWWRINWRNSRNVTPSPVSTASFDAFGRNIRIMALPYFLWKRYLLIGSLSWNLSLHADKSLQIQFGYSLWSFLSVVSFFFLQILVPLIYPDRFKFLSLETRNERKKTKQCKIVNIWVFPKYLSLH